MTETVPVDPLSFEKAREGRASIVQRRAQGKVGLGATGVWA